MTKRDWYMLTIGALVGVNIMGGVLLVQSINGVHDALEKTLAAAQEANASLDNLTGAE